MAFEGQDTITISVSLLVWLGSLAVAGLMALVSAAVHLLISIKSSLSKLVTQIAVSGEKTEGRLQTLERHDLLNAKERSAYIDAMLREGK